MSVVTRRELIVGASAIGASALLSRANAILPVAAKFRFVHMTDLHIQPELGATEGVAAAIAKINALSPRPDFVLIGGDHFMDMLACSHDRANVQALLLQEALKRLEIPSHSCVGNHDVFGWSGSSPTTSSDPLYGKNLLAEKVIKAPLYRSFDHKGWHFVILDSIQAKGKDWTSGIDDAQLAWFKSDIEKAAKAPTIVMTHMPVMSLINQYTVGTTSAASPELILANGKDIFGIIAGQNVKAVLQGHTHVVEACNYLGTEYITGGAVCGEWWKGPRLGVHPEGFMVFDVEGDRLSHEYVAYGWKAKS